MLLPRHGHIGAECCLELLKLRTAEPLARFGCSADRAMVFDQQETAVCLPFELRHVALGSSQPGQGADAISLTTVSQKRTKLAIWCGARMYGSSIVTALAPAR